ncbi:hypothetical protein CC80DRAFT_533913 [Byssothecium circinans]|uniref:RING-type domain-containing protein n=1 Tax=Byssothecium circinans TaxID=147558 RepID=A0A6A5UCW4_9PLEO|nr:hypothetical protein CC80DRAFT_533913 [Byssothecium circinans]
MQKRPTHSAVSQFIATVLPPKTNDVQFLYHTPRNPRYNPDTARVDEIVHGVTPTSGVYDHIAFDPLGAQSSATRAVLPRPPCTICFLHRPFNLERRRVRKGTLVLATHTSFDENLTVGWNIALAERLGMKSEESICVQGYKGDPERKIGIIGKVNVLCELLQRRIKIEFGGVEYFQPGSSDQIQVVAIMNAFNADEVYRVLEMAQQKGWITSGEKAGRHVMYLTGQPRDSGLRTAEEHGVAVACVGHVAAEEWGIRYLAGRLQAAFPGLAVKEVTEFAARWESPRKRSRTMSDEAQTSVLSTKKHRRTSNCPHPCPHKMDAVRPTRHANWKTQCAICLEEYFDTPTDREQVVPVKMGCGHVFCRECIETHLSSNIRCPLPWCEAQLQLQPDDCELCAYWEKSHADYLVVTVRAKEMAGSIKDELERLATESSFFKLSKTEKTRLMSYVSDTLKQYEWQYHSGIDLAELLDPFLRVLDPAIAREHYGSSLYTPATDPSIFPPRANDPDDYPAGREPWIAAFFRQWALEYEKENGEVKEGWGVWANKTQGQTYDSWEWEWPYKRIMAHKTASDGHIQYLVKWIGNRYPASWVDREQLADGSHDKYDEQHGIVHPGPA